MRRGAGAALALAALAACSGATDIGNGVIAIELRPPAVKTIDFGDTARFGARALDKEGDSVAAEIVWVTPAPDTTLILDERLGLITSAFPSARLRVQARLGNFFSGIDTIRVTPRPDTLILAGAEALDVLAGEPASGPLLVRLESFEPAGPLAAREIRFEITSPTFADPAERTVELANGALADTVLTDAGGLPSPAQVVRRVGATQPAEVLVTARAFQRNGTEVPGSGRVFTIRFP